MVVSETIITSVKTEALSSFDTVTHMGFGTSGTAATISDTTLGAEVIRKALEASSKDIGAGTYRFTGKLALGEGNGNTFQENGTFNASSGGTMFTRNTYTGVAKTSDVELSSIVEVKVEVTLI